MPDPLKLARVFEEARRLLTLPDNDFAWSSWEDGEEALAEVDGILGALHAGEMPDPLACIIHE